ncbi:MAG: hypothetical protein ACMXYB_04345 [Candidatus Woesearchaeota archaeon]
MEYKKLFILFKISSGSYFNSIENTQDLLLLELISTSKLKSDIIIYRRREDLINFKDNFNKINSYKLETNSLNFINIELNKNIFSNRIIELSPRLHSRNIVSIDEAILFLKPREYKSLLQELTAQNIEILDSEIKIRSNEIFKLLKF